ncbi:MAG: serine/threonine protein kinase [Polyangiaceae bacterium]|nr:serine/threonine protein kinase [Polyangiaceae bacterium]
MSDATPDLLRPGQLFAGRYRIVRFLAKGGMGAVFIGEHTGTEQRVAIKVLWPNVLASESAVEKFQLEARVAGRVRSDHIVQVIDAGFDPDGRMPFLVMELLEGQNLEDVVVHGGPLSPTTLLTYLSQVASGLDRAHGYCRDGAPAPIVHRDLKPENLFLVRRDDGAPLVKILDFGIAKVVSEGTKMSQEIKGTPLFMAFEQAAGGRITPATDVWALGLIAFWLLTGKSYWRAAESPEATISNLFGEILTLELAPATQRAREHGVEPPWPPAFDPWLARCLARDPSQRFQSAGEAVAAMADALGLVAPRASRLPDPPVPAGAPSVTGSSPLAHSAAALSATRGPAAPPRRSRALVPVLVGGMLTVGGGVTALLMTRAAPPTSAAAVSTAEPAAAPAPVACAAPSAVAPASTVAPASAVAPTPPPASAAAVPASPRVAAAAPSAAAPRTQVKPPPTGAQRPASGDKETYGSR